MFGVDMPGDVSELKIFGKWKTAGISVKDLGLKDYINLDPVLVPRSGGRHAKQPFHKSKVNIVERLINKLMVPGHRSKKHLLTSGRATGKYIVNYNIVKDCFDLIEKKTKKNPVEVLVRAIENTALREEVASYQVGGIIVRRAVVTSPQRRIDVALRAITQASYRFSFGKKRGIVEALAEEIIAASENNASKSQAVKEKERVEREAEGAR